MIILILILVGLCLGSFINALVWRLRQQEVELTKSHPSKTYLKKVSVFKGRSLCPNCQHKLLTSDLVPIFSWLYLKGKCRYCSKRISVAYPIIELLTAVIFVLTYLLWPSKVAHSEVVVFGLWLLIITGFIALFLYDYKWKILPTKIIYTLSLIALIIDAINILKAQDHFVSLVNVFFATVVGGGLFYLLFQVSNGKWIGGGDVRLGWLLGLLAGTPARSLLIIFLASLLGSLIALPLLNIGRLKRNSVIPFGPFLITGAYITQVYGNSLINWYKKFFIFHG